MHTFRSRSLVVSLLGPCLALAFAACSNASGAEPVAVSRDPLAASGDAPPPAPPHGARRAPPPEALEACKSSHAGDGCSVTLGDRTIDGTCRPPPDGDGALACVPSRPPGPPPEAVEACNGASEGSACHISLATHDINGTCRKGPDGNGPLACAPANMPPPPAH